MTKIIILLLLFFTFNCNALSTNNLEFHATKSCPAYLSKNKKTNPNNLLVEPGVIYPVVAINKYSADWLQVKTADQSSLRWVSKECGFTEGRWVAANSCDSAGLADSYVLAISSQPGFCETYGYEAGKPECRKLTKSSYQASHLTLHGLWPNKDLCGQHYGFCGVKPEANHCDYSPVSLSFEVSTKLQQLMPSFLYGSCLERHEWNKHGSCQSLSADEYFSLAMHLTMEADQSAMGQYLRAHQGQKVLLSDLRKAIVQAFGVANQEKVSLGCKDNILVDIYIQLPSVLSANESLLASMNKASRRHTRDLCGKVLTISHFNKDSWLP